MNNLPIEITRKIYEYDSTYHNVFKKVLVQLRCHFLYIIALNVANLGTHVYVMAMCVLHISSIDNRFNTMKMILIKMEHLILYN